MSKKQSIPESILEKLFDATGTRGEAVGYILCYINDQGMPVVATKAASPYTAIALQKALEIYFETPEFPHGL